ncbi:MAG: energy transducer TonB [Planctomycetes bacterium]|nr:energy transducer TonB [Planctomycetota bacterium]
MLVTLTTAGDFVERIENGTLTVSLALTAMLFGSVFVGVLRFYGWLGVPARTRWAFALAAGIVLPATILVYLATPPYIETSAAKELPPLAMSLSQDVPDASLVPPPKPLPPETEISESSREAARPKGPSKKTAPAKPAPSALRRYLAQQPRLRGAGTGSAGAAGIGIGTGGGGGGGGGGAPIALASELEFAASLDDALGYAEYQRARHEAVSARGRAFQPGRNLEGRAAAGAGGTPAQKIHTPKPPYPQKARNDNTEGFVVVRVLISRTGDVEVCEIVAAQPAGIFEETVEKTILQWRFEPAKDREGRPIESQRQFNLVFKMEDA